MSLFDQIHPVDKKLAPIVASPVWLVFIFLGLGGLGTSGGIWVYWGMAFGGLLLSGVIWLTLYFQFVLVSSPPRRALFYLNCILAQLSMAAAVIAYIFYRYSS